MQYVQNNDMLLCDRVISQNIHPYLIEIIRSITLYNDPFHHLGVIPVF